MKRLLPVIVISQFFCTSLWFAGNAVMGDMAKQLHLQPQYLAHIISAVQFGFIVGTFIFALTGVSDRRSPSFVFFACAIIAALVNLAIISNGINFTQLILLRFTTGFFLAGIYPVGMKIAADHYQQGLGKSLGFLVGALVLGTAFPHLLKSLTAALPYKYVIISTSILSVAGGTAMYLLVPDGPYRKAGQAIKPSQFLKSFTDVNFRSAALGYFGHMWELYTFWVFTPVILSTYNSHYPQAQLNVPLLSFLIIAIGSLSCVVSGLVSQHIGTKKTAVIALAISGLCCIISPFLLLNGSATLLIIFMLIWSIAVIADSPMFSTLVAQNAPAQSKGTALTIVNCIGFAITIASIQLLNALHNTANSRYIYTLLAIGPLLGLIALRRRSV